MSLRNSVIYSNWNCLQGENIKKKKKKKKQKHFTFKSRIKTVSRDIFKIYLNTKAPDQKGFVGIPNQ